MQTHSSIIIRGISDIASFQRCKRVCPHGRHGKASLGAFASRNRLLRSQFVYDHERERKREGEWERSGKERHATSNRNPSKEADASQFNVQLFLHDIGVIASLQRFTRVCHHGQRHLSLSRVGNECYSDAVTVCS